MISFISLAKFPKIRNHLQICTMKELLPTLTAWTSYNKRFAVATVIKTWGSSPRPIGSTMLISEEMEMAGSVSGGCVEGAVVRTAIALMESGETQRVSFGVTDEDAWAVGLSCGGSIQVLIEPFLAFDSRTEEQAIWQELEARLTKNQSAILISRSEDGQPWHSLVLPDGRIIGQQVDQSLVEMSLNAYKTRKHNLIEFEGHSYFIQVFPRRSQMLVIGAAHISVDLVEMAHNFGFENLVIDPRGAFANKTQFSTQPDQIFEQYPEEVLNDLELDPYTFAVVLSHDPKIDDNALRILLRSDVAYIGALGSKKTHAKRVARLTEAGFSEEEIARIHAPIGMDIKAKTPKEIALSIMGEVIRAKNEFL